MRAVVVAVNSAHYNGHAVPTATSSGANGVAAVREVIEHESGGRVPEVRFKLTNGAWSLPDCNVAVRGREIVII